MFERGSRDAKVVLMAIFEAFQDQTTVGLGLDERRVVLDVLDQPVEIAG